MSMIISDLGSESMLKDNVYMRRPAAAAVACFLLVSTGVLVMVENIMWVNDRWATDWELTGLYAWTGFLAFCGLWDMLCWKSKTSGVHNRFLHFFDFLFWALLPVGLTMWFSGRSGGSHDELEAGIIITDIEIFFYGLAYIKRVSERRSKTASKKLTDNATDRTYKKKPDDYYGGIICTEWFDRDRLYSRHPSVSVLMSMIVALQIVLFSYDDWVGLGWPSEYYKLIPIYVVLFMLVVCACLDTTMRLDESETMLFGERGKHVYDLLFWINTSIGVVFWSVGWIEPNDSRDLTIGVIALFVSLLVYSINFYMQVLNSNIENPSPDEIARLSPSAPDAGSVTRISEDSFDTEPEVVQEEVTSEQEDNNKKKKIYIFTNKKRKPNKK